MRACRIPPPGWVCTREGGHKGPCAAVPVEQGFVFMSTTTTMAEAVRFMEKHRETCGEVGRALFRCFETGVCTAVDIECPTCHEKMDITDYDSI